MAGEIKRVLWGYSRRETDEQLFRCESEIEALRRDNRALCAQIQRLEAEKGNLEQELRVKDEILEFLHHGRK